MEGFGERLKQARTAKGFTQKELGEKVGITKNQVCQYESEKSYPSYDALIKLCTILDTSADWLLGIPDKKDILQT